MSLILNDVSDGIATIAINDPDRRNAMSVPVAEELSRVFAGIEEATDVRAVVVTGTPPAFSAGADLKDLERPDRGRLQQIYDGFLERARHVTRGCAIRG